MVVIVQPMLINCQGQSVPGSVGVDVADVFRCNSLCGGAYNPDTEPLPRGVDHTGKYERNDMTYPSDRFLYLSFVAQGTARTTCAR